MKFDELYKKVIDSCREFEERQVPIRLDFKIEDLRDALVESILKQKGGFMIKDVTFDGVKLEGMKNEP